MEARGKRKVVGEPLGFAGLECINQGIKVAVDFFCEIGCGDFRLVVFPSCVSFLLAVFVHRQEERSREPSRKREGLQVSEKELFQKPSSLITSLVFVPKLPQSLSEVQDRRFFLNYYRRSQLTFFSLLAIIRQLPKYADNKVYRYGW